MFICTLTECLYIDCMFKDNKQTTTNTKDDALLTFFDFYNINKRFRYFTKCFFSFVFKSFSFILIVISGTPYYEFRQRVNEYKSRSLESTGCGFWQDVLRFKMTLNLLYYTIYFVQTFWEAWTFLRGWSHE